MPKRFERHARSRWEWGSAPARSDEVRQASGDDPDPAKRTSRRKDRLYRWRHRLICTGWRGRGPGKAPARGLWVGRHMIPLPTWFGTMDLP